MTTHAPQHLRLSAPRRATTGTALRVRRGTLVATGAALAVPTSLGALLAAAPAYAAPATAPTTVPTAAPALPSTPAPVVTLRYGSRGELVKTVQQRLGVAADGAFGPKTLSAVKAFQSGRGLVADGIVGSLTWSALGGAPGSAAPAPQPPTQQQPPTAQPPQTCTSTLVRYGSTGDVVKVAQQRLGISPDGVFGAQTLSAVKAYQAGHGLTADGIVGPATWSKLGGYPCGDTAPPTPPTPTQPTPPPPPVTPPSSASGQQVLDIAKQYLGITYVWGGSTPAGFDCSGLTQYVYRQVGINLPRTSLEQSRFAAGVDVNNLQVGDLIFFYSPVHHVGIYAGNGMMLDSAKPGTQISIHTMWTTPVKAIRLVG